jgi:plastocyanin
MSMAGYSVKGTRRSSRFGGHGRATGYRCAAAALLLTLAGCGGAPAAAQITATNTAFTPSEVEVPTGGTVTWTHDDPEPHTVDFLDGEASGFLERGDTYERTFDEPGSYPFVCRFHPSMTGMVTVSG